MLRVCVCHMDPYKSDSTAAYTQMIATLVFFVVFGVRRVVSFSGFRCGVFSASYHPARVAAPPPAVGYFF